MHVFCSNYGSVGPELIYVIQGGSMAAIFGGVFGGLRSGKEELLRFRRANQATLYEHQHIGRVYLFIFINFRTFVLLFFMFSYQL